MQTTHPDLRTAADRTSAFSDVLHALQAAEEPRRVDALARQAGHRDARDVSRAVSVLVAQGLATRTPHGYAVTPLGRRAGGPESSRFPRAVAPSRQSARHHRV